MRKTGHEVTNFESGENSQVISQEFPPQCKCIMVFGSHRKFLPENPNQQSMKMNFFDTNEKFGDIHVRELCKILLAVFKSDLNKINNNDFSNRALINR